MNINKLKKAVWTFGQPLTKQPRSKVSIISDLFFWRNSDEWKTYFELLNIPAIIGADEKYRSENVELIFYNKYGKQILEQQIRLEGIGRNTVDLGRYLSSIAESYGTVAIFHSHTPPIVTEFGSYVTERGYISYRYNSMPIRGFVHGNMDAIASLGNEEYQLLGGRSFLSRKYNLQYQLLGPSRYEIGIVNSSAKKQVITLGIINAENGDLREVQEAEIMPGGCHAYPIRVEEGQSSRLIIDSHLAMARPLVFQLNNRTMDVFHG